MKKTEAYEILGNFARDIPDNCLVARSKYPELNEIEPRYLFFFEEGAVVLWNVSKLAFCLYFNLSKFELFP